MPVTPLSPTMDAAAVIQAAGSGSLEVVCLDDLSIGTKELKDLIRVLQGLKVNNPVMHISLVNNSLTDECCILLRSAFQDPMFCPSLLSMNVRGNALLTDIGLGCLEQVVAMRKEIQITYAGGEMGATDDAGLGAFKRGAVIAEEEMPHARPSEQWAALQDCLNPPVESTRRLAHVLREICDAVYCELFREEAVVTPGDDTALDASMVCKVKLPPGEYCEMASRNLGLMHGVLDILPAPVQTAALRAPMVGIGSHRLQACTLVCLLVQCACDPQHSADGSLCESIHNSGLLSRVVHLAFSLPHCSCLHTALLEALSVHTLPHIPLYLFAPLLQPNFGVAGDEAGQLPALPKLLMNIASKALLQPIGIRSGVVGMAIQLGWDLYCVCEENGALKAALAEDEAWRELWVTSEDAGEDVQQVDGPIFKLVDKQRGTLVGSKPVANVMQTGYEDEKTLFPVQALLGIREFAQMHQSLNFGIVLH